MMARRVRHLVTAVVILVIVGVAIAFGPELWHRYGDRLFSSNRCSATVDAMSSDLTAEQANNAALIVAIAVSRGLPEQAMTIALATALQESDLRNLELGDLDSLGLFQQRPSQGWGTAEQVMDPYFATNAFYDALIRVDGWETMSVTEAAQAVQRSGFPEAYTDHEAEGRVWAQALSGQAGIDAVSCSLEASDFTFDPVAAFVTRTSDDYGSIVTTRVTSLGGGLMIVTLASTPSRRDALSAWAVAVAGEHSIIGVSSCGTDWTRERGEWEADAYSFGPSGCVPGEVDVILDIA
jgi:hypothetical protein